ncbi:peptidyl-prolyl cis-trans isomerase D [Legionella geestiana]|uniref:Periplasmic chaperone PpiD n=1 Tax=Legionella geestiana TaxID=45065 RepID=A0A0W0U2K3_9GAMM|nr:SurA N-terminal domain-containing protein [Legionella geestiana]KTD01985.1 peptidyl-prolyl cis-trans isomerase D [Legionella geestiana]QBS12029.1 peptidylprolyl isomerase [Legionella geestiana]QDQ40361.1 peptidylprolyl isomerase [Legionella geestiana]STX53252.1 peptidyl-prolyl cis-trans isomerase D [Legionella geestiana]
MLQKLNERIQGLVAWIVIGLIAVTFTLFGVDYYMQSRQVSDAAAEVNGEPFTKQSFEIAWRRARQQSDVDQMTAAAEKTLKAQVLNDAISNMVTLQAAKAQGFAVSPEQANAAIVNIPQFQQDGKFSPERFQTALSGALFTPESFQSEVRQGMLLNQQRFAFMGTSFALPSELKRFVKLYMQTRDYTYLRVPAAHFIDKSSITDAEVAAWYEKNQKAFVAPEQVQVEYVTLSVPAIRNAIHVDDEQVKRYYEENRSNYLTPARWKVAHILFAFPSDADAATRAAVRQKAEDAWQALKNNPEQFEYWVKTTSDDKLSIAKGGVLPWITAGQTGFEKALAKLVEPGQISAPQKTKNGYEIFRLVAYKPASTRAFSAVQKEIRDQLTAEMAQAGFAKTLEQLTDLTYQSPDSLEPAAQALKLTVQTAPAFSRDEKNGKGIVANRQVVNAAFSHDVLDLGNNSEPVQLDANTVIVLRVKKHIPETIRPLSEVRTQVADILALEKARSRARELGLVFLSAKADGEKQGEILEANQLKWETATAVTRDGENADAAINDLAFSLPRAEARDGRMLENGDFVVVELKHINNGKLAALDKEQRDSIEQQIEANYGVMDYDLYVNGLMAKAKIVRFM